MLRTCAYAAAVALSALMVCSSGVSAATDAPPHSEDRGQGFMEHGVAGPVSQSRGLAVTVDGAGKPVILIWLADHRGCRNVLMIEGDTGKATPYEVPPPASDSPFSFLLSSRNRFYALFGGRLLEFDPVRRAFTFVGKAPARMAMAMAEDPQGLIWAVNYPNSDLVSFNPATQELLAYGSLNKENWPQYQSMALDKAGWVYVGIGNVRGQIAAFNPKTRETRLLVKEEDRKAGAGHVFLGRDGVVYGRPFLDGPSYILSEGKAEITEARLPARADLKTAGWAQMLLSAFPDGRKVKAISVPDRWVEIVGKDGDVRRLTFDYPSEGAHILSLILGPDGKVRGSTGQPLRVFAYDAAKDEFTNHGWRDENGHWNALALARGHLFSAMYSGGYLFDYDVMQPWNDATKGETNPKILANGRPDIGRPHALLAHPNGRHLIMGGTPGYGRTGGGMMFYDLDAGKAEMLTHTDLLPEQSVLALEPLGDGAVLVGGTTIAAGTGGESHATQGELFLMDFASRKITFHAPIIPGASKIHDLKVGPDGQVYGLAEGPVFFVFDPKTRTVVHQEKVTAYGDLTGGQAPRVMLLGPDKKFYVYFSKAIVRIEPGTFTHERLVEPPVPINVGIVLREGRLYFSNAGRLWSWKVPGLR